MRPGFTARESNRGGYEFCVCTWGRQPMTASLLAVLAAMGPAAIPAGQPPADPPAPAAAAQGAWSASDSAALQWEGQPYVPIGLRIDGSPDAIRAAKAAGIEDVAVELPATGAGWPEAMEALKQTGLRFFIVINSLAPEAEAIVVDPQGFRKGPVREAFTEQWTIPDASSALALLAARRDGSVRWSRPLPAQNGVIKVEADPQGLEQILLLYPTMSSGTLPDFWERWDAHRDRLLRAIQASPPGPGLRGIINPMGRSSIFPGSGVQAVPVSGMFRLELETLLRARHKTLGDAIRAWGIRSSEVRTYADIARLSPLWWGRRGVGSLYDPTTGRLFGVDQAASQAWKDIQDAMTESMHRRVNRLVAAISSLVDAPVMQTVSGWDGPHQRSSTALAGIAIEGSAASPERAIESLSIGPSVLAAWIKPGFAIATGLALPAAGQAQPSLDSVIEQTFSMGVRGWFFRAGSPEQVEAVKAAAAAARVSAPARPDWLLFPEAARAAAAIKPLGSRMWWIPSSLPGERYAFGGGLEGYRIAGPQGVRFALFSTSGPLRVRMRINDPKKAVFTVPDGSERDVRIRGRREVEATITDVPLFVSGVDEPPAPLDSFASAVSGLKALMDNFETRVNAGGQLANGMNDAVRAYETQPGTAVVTLLRLLDLAAPRAAPFHWLPIETLPENSFGDIPDIPGTGGGRAALQSGRLPGQAAAARHSIRARRPGLHEVWLAAKIPAGARESVVVQIGESQLRIADDPVQVYGPGFGWYRLGSVELGQTELSLVITAQPPVGSTVLLDTLMISAEPFRPDGARPPVDWIRTLPSTGPPGRGSGASGAAPTRGPASSASGSRPAR